MMAYRIVQDGIKCGENTRFSQLVLFRGRSVDEFPKCLRPLALGIETGESKGSRELEFKASINRNKIVRRAAKAYTRATTGEGSGIRQHGPSESISKSLRYFSVRNRSDGTQLVEEREVTLLRNLHDASRGLDLAREDHRLRTFERWSFGRVVDPRQLAARGFEYLGDRDRVRCVFCKGVLRDWRLGDDPLKEHHKHFPTCPFILHLDVGNVAAPPQFGSLALPSPATEASPDEYEPSLPGHDATAALVALEVRRCSEAAGGGQFGGLSARVDSFRDEDGVLPAWPVFAAALAGFYRAAEEAMDVDADDDVMDCDDAGEGYVSDVRGKIFVCCYACGARLNFAAVTPNEPDAWWDCHARRSHSCPHVRLHRGADYAQRFARVNASAIKAVQKLSIGNSRHRVEPREVRARLDLPLYASLQSLVRPKLRSMAEVRELLAFLIDKRLEVTGQDFESIHDAFAQLRPHVAEFNVQRADSRDLTMTKFLNAKKEAQERLREELRLRSARVQQSIERGLMESLNPLRGMNDEQLSEFNRQLKDNRACKICMDHVVDTVFLPCGHLVTCHDCAPKVKTCPVCRLPITSTVLTCV